MISVVTTKMMLLSRNLIAAQVLLLRALPMLLVPQLVVVPEPVRVQVLALVQELSQQKAAIPETRMNPTTVNPRKMRARGKKKSSPNLQTSRNRI
ncbi:hypothetical protein C463_06277 [Halorubrum californiense DSM 19288]|uniref:Uncharacterized protein n=1 Tax=Halorubrum californiense DSM 19288 TaxID=1227465 RepID=M0EGJ0_9EURY|nr:hypothetical protein C463_06277 [Halorubrum californiense DSM 19288]